MASLTPYILSHHGQPVLQFSDLELPASPTNVLRLKRGSVRIIATGIESSASADLVFQIDITKGLVQLSEGTIQTIGLNFNTPNTLVKVTLTVTRTAPVSWFSTELPGTCTFEFTAAGGKLISCGGMTQSIFGGRFTLAYDAARAPALAGGILGFPLKPATNDVHSLGSTEDELRSVRISAIGNVTSASWAFQLFSPIPNTPPPMDLSGATVDIAGQISMVPTGIGALLQPSKSGAMQIHTMGRSATVHIKQGSQILQVPLHDKGILRASGGLGPSEVTVIGRLESQEFLTIQGAVSATLSVPRTINGARFLVAGSGSVSLSQEAKDAPILVQAGAAPSATTNRETTSFALKNLLVLCLPATNFNILATLLPKDISGLPTLSASSGEVSLNLPIISAVPFLPDPYVTNVLHPAAEPGAEAATLGNMAIAAQWSSHGDSIDIDLPPTALASVRLSPLSHPELPYGSMVVEDQRLVDGFESDQFGTAAQPCLLDVSTNGSQLGVKISTAPADDPPAVEDLFIKIPASKQIITTLPPVAWEPAMNHSASEPAGGFPSRYFYPNDGPPTKLLSKAVDLVAVTPSSATDAMQKTYEGRPRHEVAVSFSLPFGIIAQGRIIKRPPVFGSILVRSPTIKLVEPRFDTDSILMEGVKQLSLRAAAQVSTATTTTSIPGSAIMLKFPQSGFPTPLSILGPGRDFNDDFGPSAARPCIPARRVDLSGFGESVSSHWYDFGSAVRTTEQVDFDVVLGRNERTMIQQVYEFVKHGARCIRTVVLQRHNSGVIHRVDSLNPGSDGLMRFKDPAIVTNSSLIRGYYNIRNIKYGKIPEVAAAGNKFISVVYDADVELAGDAGLVRVPVLGHRGFLSTNPQLHPADYAELLRTHAADIGGPINAMVKVANIELHVKGVGIAASFPSGASVPEFVLAPKVVAAFSGHGEWSFVQISGQGAMAVAAVDGIGVPLIRQERPNTPYRFADPEDLYGNNPDTDYCLLHTTPSVRVLFPRPKIEADGLNQISSLVVPSIADPYAFAQGRGLFPPLEHCIPFEKVEVPPANPRFRIAVDPEGYLRLLLPENPFQSTVTERKLKDTPSSATIVYSGSSLINLVIDSRAAVPWHFEETNLEFSIECTGFGDTRQELARITGDLICSPGAQARFDKAAFRFGPPLLGVTKRLNFLEKLGVMPPMQVSMTNDPTFHAQAEFNLPRLIEKLEKEPTSDVTPAKKDLLEKLKTIFKELKQGIEVQHKDTATLLILNAEATIHLSTGLGWGGLLTGKFSMTSAPRRTFDQGATSTREEKDSMTIEGGIGGGASYTMKILGCGAEAYGMVTVSLLINLGTKSVGVGLAVLVGFQIALTDWLTVGVSTEAKGILLAVECQRSLGSPPTLQDAPTTIWGVLQFTVAIDVHICLIFDISIEESWEASSKWNNGPCELEEFGPIP